jgi:predicted O-linked N-acetylglucosamine transferase (SPINDLY family)
MREATLFLDSVGFSGFNTAMQAIECGLPIVALEGDSLRGRFASGLLRQVGLEESIATDAASYAALAEGLVRDPARRLAIASHLRKHGQRLFGTREPVDALAAFLESRAVRS